MKSKGLTTRRVSLLGNVKKRRKDAASNGKIFRLSNILSKVAQKYIVLRLSYVVSRAYVCLGKLNSESLVAGIQVEAKMR